MKTSEYLYVTKEDILAKHSEEFLFEHYFGSKIKLSSKYTNPLRDDDTADCTFFYGDDELTFRDWAKKEIYSVWTFVQAKHQLPTYVDAIRKIASDFNVKPHLTSPEDFFSTPTPVKRERLLKKTNKLIDIKVRPITPTTAHFDYWSTIDYDFTKEDFEKFRILCIDFFRLVFEEYHLDVDMPAEMAFSYLLLPNSNEFKQVYRPHAEKTLKFRQLMKRSIYGLEFLDKKKDYVVITKSYKDWVILQLAGVNSCLILSENYNLSSDDKMFFSNYRFVFTLFDNDETGKKRSEDWSEKHKTIPMLLPFNDSYDHYKIKGLVDLRTFITTFIDDYRTNYKPTF